MYEGYSGTFSSKQSQAFALCHYKLNSIKMTGAAAPEGKVIMTQIIEHISRRLPSHIRRELRRERGGGREEKEKEGKTLMNGFWKQREYDWSWSAIPNGTVTALHAPLMQTDRLGSRGRASEKWDASRHAEPTAAQVPGWGPSHFPSAKWHFQTRRILSKKTRGEEETCEDPHCRTRVR